MAAARQTTDRGREGKLHHHRVMIDDLDIFYREGGPVSAPTLVLFHGFPSASHQYVPLMRRLAGELHLVAPDYPGFGHSSAPRSTSIGGDFTYTFDHLAMVMARFLDENGNAYEVGLGPKMQPAIEYWSDREGRDEEMRAGLTLEATRSQHLDGVREPEFVDPDTWLLDQYWLDRPGRDQIMLDLLYDYQSNLAAYPTWQEWFRERRPPLLLPWGKNDLFFPEAGARAYLEDLPTAELHLLDTGHFALDDHLEEIAELTIEFIARHTE